MKNVICSLLVAMALATGTVGAQQTASVENLRRHVEILASDSLAGRRYTSPEIKMAVDYITAQYAETGISPLNDTFLYPFSLGEETGGTNIVGVIEGSDPILKNEYIVFGAHYDHLGTRIANGDTIVFNGADDNASGVATIIEVGRLLESAEEKPLRSILLIAFDGEESGLLGSSAFMDNPPVPAESIKLMFSLDMVGMLSANKGVNLKGMKSIDGGEKLALRVAESTGIDIRKAENEIESRTDTWSFALKAIPAVEITTGTKHTPYHKPEDDSYLLDYEGMAKITDFIVGCISEIASQERLVANMSVINRSVNPRLLAGISFNYGLSNHNYPDDFYRAKSVFAFKTGMVSQLKITKTFAIQPGVTYSLYGSDSESGKFHMHSVMPQLDLVLMKARQQNYAPNLMLSAGGYYRYNFAASRNWKPLDFNGQYAKDDAGIRLGIGYQFMKTQILFLKEYGMTDISTAPDGTSIRNRGSYCSVTLFF